jgi:cell division protease FtsH
LWYVPLALILLWLWQDVFDSLAVKTISYAQFKKHLAQGEVVECELGETEIKGVIKIGPTPSDAGAQPDEPTAQNGESSESGQRDSDPIKDGPETPPASDAADASDTDEPKQPPAEPSTTEPTEFTFRTVRVDDSKLVEELQAQGVEFTGVPQRLLTQIVMAWLLPMGLFLLLWMFLARRIGAAGQAVMSVGKSRAKLVGDHDTGVTFNDVAGCDEAKYELQEVVDFLKNPARYAALGAKIPKGVLLVGPPGTGKTLLGKAVAGEARVPFFSLSGSDFVEMFVGVGASRVRDLFDQATKQAPCIVFIDELDAIGRERGVHVGPVNDEREQTLNQLLVEMDGFEPNAGVILLAATNRPEVLDRALLRPGRFDRQVVVDAPDIDGREAILQVHSRDKPLAEDVNLRTIAQATPGLSGADLANIMNEAALLAARRNVVVIAQRDIEEAIEKVVAGPERKSRRLDEDEKRRVAYHEVGHALVGAFSTDADPVHKISIVPRGRAALGYTLQLPTGDQFLLTRSELMDRIKGLLGGRAAEELVFGEVSTGAENDLERATNMARQMVSMYGMSDLVGLLHCRSRQPMYLRSVDGNGQLDCSEKTAEKIDFETSKLLGSAYEAAKKVLSENRNHLEEVSQALLVRETLDAATFYGMIGLPLPKQESRAPAPPPVGGE